MMVCAATALDELRVLLVDPRRDERRRLASMLARARPSARFESAGDARAVHVALAAGEFDLLLIGQRLPDGDGASLLAELAAGGGAPPALLLLAEPDPEEAVRALRAGALDCLVLADLSAERLDMAIRLGLERRRARLASERAHGELLGAHRELLRAHRELLRSSRELEHLAAAAAHDLQEPLRTMRFLGERLAAHSRERLDERGRDHLDRMLLTGSRMEEMVRHTLLLSRLSGVELHPRRVELDAVLEGVRGVLAAALDRTGARLEVAPLPAVRGSEAQLARLFLNLLTNALKFVDPTRPPFVQVRALPGGPDAKEVAIEVRDNGIGFPGELARELFVPYRRLHSRARGAGHGIGLAICRAIVENHGGRISAAGTPDQGASFTLTLPLAAATSATPRARLRRRGGRQAAATATDELLAAG